MIIHIRKIRNPNPHPKPDFSGSNLCVKIKSVKIKRVKIKLVENNTSK